MVSKQDRTRSNGLKLEKYRFTKEIGLHWFANKIVEDWHKFGCKCRVDSKF